MTELVDLATQLALTYHNGHTGAHDGQPYLLHVQRVAIRARERAESFPVMREPFELPYLPNGYLRCDVAESIGWLHHIVEDTECTEGVIQSFLLENGVHHGVAIIVVDAVSALTKTGGSNLDYYERVKRNSYARLVKLSDIQDNFRRNHLIESEDTRLRMVKKYSLGMDMLGY